MNKKLLREITDPNNSLVQRKSLFQAINKSNEGRHVANISSTILTAEMLLFFLSELEAMGSSFFKHGLKKKANVLKSELLKIEEAQYDKIFESSEMTHMVTSNLHEGVKFIVKNGFSSMLFLMKCEMLFKEDPEKIGDYIDNMMVELGLTTEIKK